MGSTPQSNVASCFCLRNWLSRRSPFYFTIGRTTQRRGPRCMSKVWSRATVNFLPPRSYFRDHHPRDVSWFPVLFLAATAWQVFWPHPSWHHAGIWLELQVGTSSGLSSMLAGTCFPGLSCMLELLSSPKHQHSVHTGYNILANRSTGYPSG
jgi:hypothetical protein